MEDDSYMYDENDGGEDEEEEEEDEDLIEGEDSFDVSGFIIQEDDTVDSTGDENIDSELELSSAARKNVEGAEEEEEEEEDLDELERKSKKLEEIFSCLPPVLIKRILRREDVKGNVEKASQKLQEFQDMENPSDLFKNPAAARPSIGKPKGKFDEPEAHGSIKQAWVGEEKPYRVPEPKSYRGKKKRGRPGNKDQMHREHVDFTEVRDLRRNSFDGDNWDQREGNQAYRGHNTRQRGRTKGGQRGGPRGGFFQGQNDIQGYRENQFYASQERRFGVQNAPQPQRGRGSQGGQRGGPRSGFLQGQNEGYRENPFYTSQEWRLAEEFNFHPQRGRGSQGGRGRQPKPKPKPKCRDRGYRGPDHNFQKQGEHQIPGEFQESDQFPYDDDHPQCIQRQAHQPNRRRRDSHERRAPPVSLSALVNSTMAASTPRDDSDLGQFRKDEPSKRGQGNRGRPRDGGGNRGRGQRGMRRAQSMSSVEGEEPADAEENVAGQSHFERNKLLVRGLSQLTTPDGLENFIEAMSGGEEVKKVVMLKNGSALVTMADDIKNFRNLKSKGEKRGLDKAKVSIEQVPVCKSILVTGFSDNTTHDAIELYFESRRNSGGPVEKVHYVPERGRAVVVFQDTRDMDRVLARHEEKPHVLNQTQLSIKVYREFLDGEEGDEAEDTGDLGATVDEIAEAQVSQQPEAKTQQLHMAVDPDVMEYVTTTAFEAQLNNSLTVKKSEITWKPNNKMAVIVYRGGDESDSWQSECIDEVQNFLGKFAKCDVQVNKDIWEAVVAQVPSIRACLGVDPPLIKTIGDSHVARIVSLDIDVKNHEEKVKSKLEEIYREETRKTYLKKKIPNVSEERLILLKKIKFAEKLQDKNKELEIKLDTEGEEIYFEGPQPQFTEATMKFYKQMTDMVEKKLTLSVSILEVLSSDEGLQTVKRELESNNVEAVFVIDRDARIVGTSAAHADNAARLVNKLMLEDKVQVDEKSNHLLKSDEWTELCKEMNTQTAVRVHRNNWNDTYVAGFRDDVTEVMKKLNSFLENNCIREENFVCTSDIVRRYLVEVRQEDLRSIEDQLKDFAVKIKKGKGDDDFDISGNKEGLKHVRRKIDALVDATESKTIDVKQPGLRKYFDSGKGDRLVKSVEKDQDCVVEVQKNLGQKDDELRIESATEDSASSSDADDADDDDEPAASGSDVNTLATTHGHKISWRPGNIEVEKADVLVSSQGACAQAIINAGGPRAATPNAGDITVSGGFASVSHVIHTNCCKWNNGGGEATLRAIVQKCLQKGEELGATSIAFPVIGTGNLNFPRDAASRIMLEETIIFCQANAGSNVQDIRFVVHQQDQALTAAFKQEMDKLKTKHKFRPAYIKSALTRGFRSMFRRRAAGISGRVSIEVLQSDLCLETTDAIVNINSKDLNMDSAGELSKEVKKKAGQQVQDELNKLGQQSGGSAVITSGGNLRTRHIIHLIPDAANKDHLQQCVERCLRLAETNGLSSVSIPAVGTGSYGMSAVDSASLIFKALNNFSGSFNNVHKVRIVIFKPQMLSAFQQEYQRHSVSSKVGGPQRIGLDSPFSVEVINDDLTKEKTDAIMNINSTDMNMNNAGELSKVIANASGPQVQQECTQLGKQASGSAVMTSGGNLRVPHIVHIIPGSSDKQHLQQCLEEGLRVADAKNLQSISIPCVGTGGFGLAAADSAQVTFQALNTFSGSCKSIRKVRVVVFKASMMQEFLQEQQMQPMQDMADEDSDWEDIAGGQPRRRRQAQNQSHEHFVRICVVGKDKLRVGKAVESLKKGFSEACTTEKVESDVISELSHKQIDILRRKAEDRDVKLVVEADVDRISVRGEPSEVSGMVGEIWKEISERTKKKQEEEQAQLVSKNIEWSYEIHGNKMAFGPKTNAKIEMAHSKEDHTVQVSLHGDQFVIDLKTKTGRGQQSGDQITVKRKVKGAEEGIALPRHWAPMPSPDTTVHTVQLLPGSSEYQDVKRKFHTTASGVNITKIERVQNPHLYQSYMVRKQKMDKDTGGNSERQLFHGTDAKNITSINTQGLNRSFAGVHGVALGRGVYFARDAQYSLGYARGGGGTRYMYLARVLVGQYCQGNSNMIVPPPKNSSRPEILYESVVDNPANPSAYVVFYDNQCYPEYLITIQ